MLRKIYSIILIILAMSILHVSASPLCAENNSITNNDTLRISIITCDPGPDVYQIFGHTAIRVQNSGNTKYDYVFNYGTFSFTDDFVYKFVKGETDYLLSVSDFQYFLFDYYQRESSVYEQELNLTPAEEATLLNLLILNAQPDNREYRYNFLYDNCATRPRDIIKWATDSNSEKIVWSEEAKQISFREIIHHYGHNYSWLLMGIDLALGCELDSDATWQQQMFIPLILQKACRDAQIECSDGSSRPLIASETTIYNSGRIPILPPTPWYLSPLFATLLFLFLTAIVTWHDVRFKKLSRWFDTIINALFFLMSIIIYFLIFESEHPATTFNINALWMTPLAIIPCILIWIKKSYRILQLYYILQLILSGVFLIVALCGVQQINIAVYPLVLLAVIRACNFINYFKTSICK